MKVKFLPLIFLLCSSSLVAQRRPEWVRVYTFDESIIEMNTRLVSLAGKGMGRVKFRWTFEQPEAYSRDHRLKYKSRLEVIDFDCEAQRFRQYDITFIDPAGKIVGYEAMFWLRDWSVLGSSGVMSKIAGPACELIDPPTHVRSPRALPELEKATNFALAFTTSLERSKDFKPIIQKFFAPHYLDGYIRDKSTKWFLNLERDTAAKTTPAELQRFYTALMNTGYLSSLYVISRYQPDAEEIPTENLVPPEVMELIKNHPYTAAYGGKQENFDYLAEKIDSVERLRSYTDLLEKMAGLFLRYVKSMTSESSEAYRTLLEESENAVAFSQPSITICPRECLGLPKGTRLFEVNVPLFHLQLAEIKGKLRVVSIMHSSS